MSVFYFNRLPVLGPWGGGNKTLTAIANRLTGMGHTVVGDYRQDIDKIFCVDPRPNNSGIGYSHLRAFADRTGIPIIQRVGDVGSHGKPDLASLVAQTAVMSETVIFTSEWARRRIGVSPRKCSVIANGALPVFFEHRRENSLPARVPRIVTHHWSNNPMKGLDFYERLCADIDKGRVELDFTYIGRSSQALSTRTVHPMDEKGLARSLPQFDIYLTASREEAGANHIVEAMACGLPVVYSSHGGSIPEYCGHIGTSFSDYEGMLEALKITVDQYAQLQRSACEYTRSMDDVVAEYVEVLCKG